MSDSIKYTLGEHDIPKAWYNIVADLPSPPPAATEIQTISDLALHGSTGEDGAPGTGRTVLSWQAERSEADVLELSIQLDGDAADSPPVAHMFQVTGPTRWVVDIPGLIHPQAPRRQDLDGETFISLRSAQFRGGPTPVARWVLTVGAEVSPPTVGADGPRLRIRFEALP